MSKRVYQQSGYLDPSTMDAVRNRSFGCDHYSW